MFDTRISDAEGHRARVTPEGDLVASITPNPPLGSDVLLTPFIDYMTVNGVIGGSSNMNLNGSVNNIRTSITARENGDVYLSSLSILISAQNLSINRFGGINGGLVNGLQFFYRSSLGLNIAPLLIKTNFDLLRLGTLSPALGNKADAYQIANAVNGTEDAYLSVIDLTKLGGQNYGIRLRVGTLDKLGFVIRDNLTTISRFDILASGFTRIIKEKGQD